LASIKQTNGMTFFIIEGQSLVEELKMFLADSQGEIKQTLDKLYFVVILYMCYFLCLWLCFVHGMFPNLNKVFERGIKLCS